MRGMWRIPRGLAAAALVAILAAGCSQGANPTNPTPDATTPSAPVFVEPVEGEVPAQQEQIAGSGAPRAYPVLTEEKVVQKYLEDMLEVNFAALKNRQPYEVKPKVIPVKKQVACTKVPGAKRKVVVYKVGDKAPAQSPLLAACVKGNKLVMYYAPIGFYRFYKDYNVTEVRATIIRATQDYLAYLSRNRLGGGEGYFAECAGGRLIGGLLQGNYVEVGWGNAQNVDGAVDTESERVYTTARDTGWCANEWLDEAP
jgi:hypothetical protein